MTGSMTERDSMIEEIAARRAAEVQDEAGGAESADHHVEQPAADTRIDDLSARANELLVRAEALESGSRGAAFEPPQAEVQLRESIAASLEAALDGDVDTAATMLSSAIAEQPALPVDETLAEVSHRVRMQLVHDGWQRENQALLRDPVAARAVDAEFARLCPKNSSGAPLALAPAQFESLLEAAAIAVGRTRSSGSSSGESTPQERATAIAEIAAGRGQAPFESGER